MAKIYVAGGCFWGVEAYFQMLDGVLDTTVGYAQGDMEAPTYEQVCSHLTGHTETVEIVYDPLVISREDLFAHLFHIINPTSLNRQGNDSGSQYRTGIYSENDADLEEAKTYIQKRQADYELPIVVEVAPLKTFYPAEDYHQDYLQKNPGGYCHIDLSARLK